MMQISELKKDSRMARVEMCFKRHRKMVSIKKLASMKNVSMFQSIAVSESIGYSTAFLEFSAVVT